MQGRSPLGVHEDLAEILRELHDLWHDRLLSHGKKPGWGVEFDERSDELFGKAGRILSMHESDWTGIYRFGIAYGRLSMTLPYIAYHTVDAIIMAFGVLE